VLALLVVAPAVAEDVYSPETLEIARDLQCPVCGGQSVADSNAELARQMRAIIEQKVQAGESPEQIRAYFVERYGPGILSDPPKSGFTLTLWWVPLLAVAAGALILALFVRERTRIRRPPTPSAADRATDDELESIARDALGADPHAEASAP
jgi:cytochrome c-type biogenesis protein CcmH